MKRKGPRRNVQKQRFWQHAVREQARSGKSVRQFCREHSLSEPSFYAWRQELKRRRSSAQSIQVARHKTDRPAFVPVEVIPSAAASIECLLPSGIVLRLPTTTEPARIAEVLCAWERERC